MSEPLTLEPASLIARFDSSNLVPKYFEFVQEENVRVNIVSRETIFDDFEKMLAESLLPLEVLARSYHGYLDIGSGGGIPAVAIMLSGLVSQPIWLVERTRKKTAALGRILDKLGLEATVIPKTFEEVKLTERFELVTLRYVKLTRQLLARIMPAVAPSGVFVYYAPLSFDAEGYDIQTISFRDPKQGFDKTITVFRRGSEKQ